MDRLSSPASNTSSTTTAPTSASMQPTYTTAGTIYNPGSSQPLQPPTRRGRSAKWAAGQHSDLCLFPKSVLAGLTMKATNGGRVATTLQQYTPLQQNYDRAVSPLSEPEHSAINVSLQTPRMRSGNTPAPLSFLFPDKYDDKDAAKERIAGEELGNFSNEEGEDDDDDFGMDPLMNMTVKSLNNLASYPNPNQKKAQKALLRGARPNLGGLGGLGGLGSVRISASPSPSLRAMSSPEEPKMDVGDKPLGLLRPSQVDVTSKIDLCRMTTRLLPTARSPSPASNFENVDAVPTSSTTLATGPGAPRPLTAGPPGQRQYRPSTFESTFKALHTKAQAQDLAKEDSEGFAIAKQTLAHVGIEDINSLTLESLPSPRGLAQLSTARQATQPKSAISEILEGSEPDVEPARHEAPGFAWDRALDMSWTSWRDTSPSARERYRRGTARLTLESVAVRNERIDSFWYTGSALLGKKPEEIVAESSYRRLQHSYGVIGDGRPKKTKTEYPPIGVKEATRTPVSEHTEPLVNMAFATLVRHAEEKAVDSPFRQFGTPAERLCDNSVKGNASFFSKPMQSVN
ncbi:Uncharacterized protein TCAP_04547 [Tolypocladium capitatum]|uniref:Uncharacterized protein n=1 Tax=Tolypocladium capitatum TaxID=45235 RepID=A0A2K3QDB5_9HYPO|nr:Uncharacterized protein TCAP_04547 [Tolypocladium capitatum]